MKKLVLIILFFCPVLAGAQSLSREAVTSGGGEMTAMGYELSFSFGQFATATLEAGSGPMLTQGFQQINYNCPGDFNFDGFVNTEDLLLFLGQFGCVSNCSADLNQDGVVNTQDLLFFLGFFGTQCGGS